MVGRSPSKTRAETPDVDVDPGPAHEVYDWLASSPGQESPGVHNLTFGSGLSGCQRMSLP